MFSFSEIFFLGLIALIFIGPKQLPEVARNIARFLNELRRASKGMLDQLMNEKEELKKNTVQPLNQIQNEILNTVNENTIAQTSAEKKNE